jgi:hypothetical protein
VSLRLAPRRGAVAAVALLAAAIGVVAWLNLGRDADPPPTADPEDGRVVGGRYVSRYFDLVYPLPPGFVEGLAGPAPSETGSYVLANFVPAGELDATILVAALDRFFAPAWFDGAEAMAADFARGLAGIEGMTVDRAPDAMMTGGRRFVRVDFSGVGLYRAMLATDIRCHVVSFTVTARTPERRADLLDSVGHLSSSGVTGPACLKDHAGNDNLLHRVAPAVVGPQFVPIPVRMIVAVDGSVRHAHVIRATAEQRRSVAEAVRQWRFKPHLIDGRAVEVETGVVFRFGPSAPGS